MMRSFLMTLVLLGATALFAGQAFAAQRIALIIGNSTYENTSPLRNAVNDAELMAETLGLLGFEVTLVTEADRRQMARDILDFGRSLSRAGPDSVGLFYYAGHGVQAHGTNYLIPLQSQVDTEADLEIEAIDANWVLSQMDEAANGLNIVILDACRNNPYQGSFRSGTRGLARLDAPAGSLIAYSAAPGQTAVDGEGKNSPYTRSLADAMRQPGVELLQVFRRVRVDVESETAGRQTPWEEQSLRTDFFFVPPVAEQEEEQVAVVVPEAGLDPPPDTQPPGDASGVQLEILFWNSVKDSNDPGILQAYLDRYPNGVFAGLASVLIDRLREEQLQQSAQQPQADQDEPGAQGQRPAGPGDPDAQQQGEQDSEPDDDGEFDVATVDPDAPSEQPSGPGEIEPQTDPDLPRDIQAALDEAGCSPGPVDGIWGRRSQQALEQFARHASLTLPEEAISVATLEMIEGLDGRVCPLQCGRRYEVRNGQCVLKTCASGKRLNSAGNCVTQQANAPSNQDSGGSSGSGSSGGSSGTGGSSGGSSYGSSSSSGSARPESNVCGGGRCCCDNGGAPFCVGAGACITRYLGSCTGARSC